MSEAIQARIEHIPQWAGRAGRMSLRKLIAAQRGAFQAATLLHMVNDEVTAML
ncbi:MAG TPA: hypothetical protein VGR05_01070 [Sphingomicrobium sp.]|nr:hypothetical protein [Sphingomicrobium sp.]